MLNTTVIAGAEASIIPLFLTLAIFMILFNGAFIYTISRFQDLQTTTNLILLSLAVNDFIHGAVVVPLAMLNLVPSVLLPPMVCLCLNCLQSSGNVIASSHLLAVTLERYMAIVFPLRHRRLNVSWNYRLMIALCWVVPTVLGFTPMMGLNNFSDADTDEDMVLCHIFMAVSCEYFIFYLAFLGCSLVLIWCCYIHMFYTATRRQNVAAHTTALRVSDFRGAVLVISTVGFFTVSTLPLSIGLVLHCLGITFPHSFWSGSLVLFYSNSMVDPLIYGLGNKTIRETFVSRVLRKRPSQRNSNVTKRTVYSVTGPH